MKINDLPDKEIKITVITMLTEDRRMHERSDDFNKETETIRRYQIEATELKNTITALKNTIKGFNNRLH